VKPDGWEETAAYDEQNELHVAVLQLVFCMFSSRASVKTGSTDFTAKPDLLQDQLVSSARSGSSIPPVAFFGIRGAAKQKSSLAASQ
jgi:hypothetical protein